MTQALAIASPRDLMTEEDLDILKKSKFRGFTDGEVAYAAKICNHLNLNPLINQIHFVKRGAAVTAQVAIDGLRLAAQRTGEYAGSEEAVFKYAIGDADQKRPTKATVTVYRIVSGQKCAFTASARWQEFFQPNGGMWEKMPHTMLGKCAEAQALRKGFPAELSSLYAPEEMDQSDAPDKAASLQAQVQGKVAPPIEVGSTPVPEEPAGAFGEFMGGPLSEKRPAPRAREVVIKEIVAAGRALNMGTPLLTRACGEQMKNSPDQLSVEELETFLAYLGKRIAAKSGGVR